MISFGAPTLVRPGWCWCAFRASAAGSAALEEGRRRGLLRRLKWGQLRSVCTSQHSHLGTVWQMARAQEKEKTSERRCSLPLLEEAAAKTWICRARRNAISSYLFSSKELIPAPFFFIHIDVKAGRKKRGQVQKEEGWLAAGGQRWTFLAYHLFIHHHQHQGYKKVCCPNNA